ncbi:sugar transporter protein [Rutstroemia sp. NJR-2017a WRK4]|nr:sugar transporter protein [Rutstroemia sp. NJR-2017a WRK4]
MTIFTRLLQDSKPDYQDAEVALATAKRCPRAETTYRQKHQTSPASSSVTVRPVPEGRTSSGEQSLRKLVSQEPITWTTEDIRSDVQCIAGSELYTSLEHVHDLLICEIVKTKVVDLAMSDIGMGRYQWELFFLCGTGWAADNLWLQGVALILPSLSTTFEVSEKNVRYATCFLFLGCCLGASFWGIMSDGRGRKLPFNMALLVTSIFGILLATAKSFQAVCGFLGALGFGVGGNLPIDGTVFLEFLPQEKRSLLTLLSVWWPLGQILASFLGWHFMGTSYAENLGWRYCVYCYGGFSAVLFIARFIFDVFESPYYLLKKDQAEAVRIVRAIATKNKTKTWLTEDVLNEIGGEEEEVEAVKPGVWAKIRHSFASLGEKLSPLFKTRKQTKNTSFLWFCWACIGMGYPLFNSFLPQLLSDGQTSSEQISKAQTYRDYTIVSAVAIPGCLFACFVANRGGRKIPMAVATMISGILFFCFSISKDSKYQLAFSCLASFFENIMFGILFSYTPETFPGYCRGTGTGIAHSIGRVAGLIAPILAANMSASNGIPYVSAGLILSAFLAMLFLKEIKEEQREITSNDVVAQV